MAEYTADRLQIEIESSTQKATDSVNKMISALERLKGATNGFKNPIVEAASGGSGAKTRSAANSLNAMKKSVSDIGKTAKGSTSALSKLFSSIKRIAFYRLIRTVIKTLTDGIRTGIENVYQYSRIIGSDFKGSMDSIASSAIYAKNAFGTFAASILQVLAPSITFMLDKFVDLVNAINEVVAILRGKDTFTRAVKVEAEFAKATDLVSKSTGEAADQMNRFLMGIDEINKTGSPNLEIGKMFEEQEVNLDFAGLPSRLEETLDNVKNTVSGIIDLVGVLAERFRIAWETNEVGKHIIENLWDILNEILGTIERAVDITKEWAKGLDFYPLLSGFEKLTAALKPFVELIMNGLLWAYENVLLPVAKWAIESAFPIMLETAAAAIELLTEVLKALQPVGEWLWNNFLKPIGEFAGDVFIYTMEQIRDLFIGITELLRGDITLDEFFDKLTIGQDILAGFAAALAIWGAITGFSKAIALLEVALTSPFLKVSLLVGGLTALVYAIDQVAANWGKMSDGQRVIAIFGALAASAGILAVALGACQSALTMGIAAIAIVGGVAAIAAAVSAATQQAQVDISNMNAKSLQSRGNQMKAYATGGYPQSGEIFLARENGAELVGSIGGHTAVANNGQIVEGISEGVAYANAGVIGAINQLIAVVQQIDPTVELDGLKVSRGLKKYERQVTREYGSPLAVEVGV